MKNKKWIKKRVRLQALVFSLLLLAAISYSTPARASETSALISSAYAQVDGQTKKEYASEYREQIKLAKSEYRKARNQAKQVLNNALLVTSEKGDRIEAKKEFKNSLKSAQDKLNTALKDAKELYKTRISG
jgi:hypothetical protein